MKEPNAPFLEALRELAREEAAESGESPSVSEAEVDRLTASFLQAVAPPPRRRFRRRALLVGGPALAAAACLLFALRSSEAPIPAYALELSGMAATRADTTVPSPANAKNLILVARPPTAVSGPLTARAFSLLDEVAPLRWPEPEIAASGAVRWTVARSEIAPAGLQSLRVLVLIGRPEALPEADSVGDAPSGPGWVAATMTVSLD